MPAKKTVKGLSDEEKAAMRETFRERKVVWGKNRADDERAVLAKIATFPEPDRSMGRRLHALITSAGPGLSPRLWYGMPAYSKDGEVLCFFQPASKFKARYGTLGFNQAAKLDDGTLWPTGFAVTELRATDEARVTALVKKAVS
ncbi:MAG: iron chaperone [Thermoplasmata archaeon]